MHVRQESDEARHNLLADSQPEPKLDIESKVQKATRLLSDREAPAQAKFRALEDFASAGGKNLDFIDLDGTTRHFKLDYEKFQTRGLLHVYSEEDGKDRVVLRAVCEKDGSYSLERKDRGQPISFYGTWWTDNMAGRSYFAPSPDATGALPADSPDINALFDKIARLASGKANKMEKLSNGAVYFRAKMDIDADGSPRAKEIDPKNGNIHTSLTYPDGSAVNAETMPYYVLPGHKYGPLNIALGDMAVVRYKGVVKGPVFADVGPSKKLGEGSMELASELNIPNSPINGGIQTPDVEYIVFPKSGDGTPGTLDGNMAKALEELRLYAGKAKK